MRSTLKSLALAILLSQGQAALAQDATQSPDQTDATEETTTEQDDSTIGSDLELGEPVGPQIGQEYVLQEFGDWAMRCRKMPEGQADPCNLYQLLVDEEGNAVAEFSLFKLPEGGRAAAGATIVVPLETLLTQQLTMSVDGASARRYPFTFCNQVGCVARVGFTAAEIDQFKRGNSATLRLVPASAPDQEVLLTLSLTGFTAGFDGSEAVQ